MTDSAGAEQEQSLEELEAAISEEIWRNRCRRAETEVQRLRQREVSCRECGEAVECGEVVFHEQCLDPAIIAARAALKQGEDGSG